MAGVGPGIGQPDCLPFAALDHGLGIDCLQWWGEHGAGGLKYARFAYMSMFQHSHNF